MWSDFIIESRTNCTHKYMSEQQRVTKAAAQLYHELNPQLNFYTATNHRQRQWEEIIRNQYAIGNSRNLPEG